MGANILVVDDDLVIVELASIILKSHGYQVQSAHDGVTCLHLLKENHPELILLDYMMPGRNGLEVLAELKRKYPDIAVIFLTGMGSEEIAVRAMKAGAADYIVKPFRNHDLLDRVASVLRLQRLETQNSQLRQEREAHLLEIEAWNCELERRVAEKSLELQMAQAEIIQSEKLATLGYLAAGMTHEIRNPLNSINLFAQILKNSCADTSQNIEFLDRIQSEIDRIDSLLTKLLSVSRNQVRLNSLIKIHTIAAEVVAAFQGQMDVQQVRLFPHIVETPPFHGDEESIRQLFSNLIANSLHAMPTGGELQVRIAHDKNAIVIEVTDNGCGIPPELQSRVFDPFFSTRPRGTGFGLSMVLRTIKTYNGKILLKSHPGQGTTFSILLPVSQVEAVMAS